MTPMPGALIPDSDEAQDTMTRTQLLRVRGYDEAVIAGNGHVGGDREDSHSLDPPVIPVTPPAPDNDRTCPQCGKSLEGRSPKAIWCSERCRRKAADDRRSPRSVRHRATPSAINNGSVVESPQLPQGADRLALVVRQLCSAGLVVTATVDGLELTVRA